MRVTRALCAVLFTFITITPTFAFAQVATSTDSTVLTASNSPQATSTVPIDPHNQADVARAVAQYFSDIPVMAAIAKCESNNRQFTDSGTVLNGGSGGMLGVFQINKTVHKAFALTLGDDITTLDGNMAYARYLYSNEGTTPWNSSKSCWGDAAQDVAVAVTSVAQAVTAAVAADVALASTSVTTPALATTTSTTATLQPLPAQALLPPRPVWLHPPTCRQ